MIPYSTQDIKLLDQIRVFRALRNPLLTQGPEVDKFEKSVADYVGAGYAVAVNSATSALHLACLALDLGPGDLMWTSPISFVASANCGLYCGAEVDFVDIDPDTFNMSPKQLKIKLVAAEKVGRLPKVLVVVHLAGEPCEMKEIAALARKYSIKIIEDASHALGSKYLGISVGDCSFSEITVFSFHAVKNITTGEGGMAVTNDSRLSSKLKALRAHGITRDANQFLTPQNQRTPWHYEQQVLGYNYRLTDFQAVLGKSQLQTLKTRNARRQQILKLYRKELSSSSLVKFQSLKPNNLSATHLAIILVPADLRDAIAHGLAQKGYATNLHYFPIHLQPFYQSIKFRIFPNAEAFSKKALSIPCHTKLKRRQVKEISKTVLNYLR